MVGLFSFSVHIGSEFECTCGVAIEHWSGREMGQALWRFSLQQSTFCILEFRLQRVHRPSTRINFEDSRRVRAQLLCTYGSAKTKFGPRCAALRVSSHGTRTILAWYGNVEQEQGECSASIVSREHSTKQYKLSRNRSLIENSQSFPLHTLY